MKRNQLIFNLGLLSLLVTPTSARDIYVYANAGQEALKQVTDVRKITFTPENMTLTSTNGETATINLSDWTYFTSTQRVVDGINSFATTKDISIKSNGRAITVTSNKAISRVTIYSTSGILIESIAPKTLSMSKNISALPAGIYTIQVVVDGKEYSQKFIKE